MDITHDVCYINILTVWVKNCFILLIYDPMCFLLGGCAGGGVALWHGADKQDSSVWVHFN